MTISDFASSATVEMEKFYFDTEKTVASCYFATKKKQLHLHLIGVLAVHWASSPVTMIIIGESECEWTFDQMVGWT